MVINNNHDNVCSRCHMHTKFFETFKKCSYCLTQHCNKCWSELQLSDDYKLLNDILPKLNILTTKRICSECMKNLLKDTLESSKIKKDDDDYQLQLALALSKNEDNERLKQQKRKLDEENITEKRFDNNQENLLEKTTETIERFMNRANSNYQRNRDVIGDTALLSAFISLQTCSADLEQLKYKLDHQRQYFERLQEKLTALRDAREALNILRYEHREKKLKEQERLEQQRRLLMIQKVADLRQLKHTQLANYQENYFQYLLNEEQKMKEYLEKTKHHLKNATNL